MRRATEGWPRLVHTRLIGLANRLSIAQSNVSRLERRDDMLLSTLREVVQALGGELKVTAVFPEGSVEITQFLGEAERPARRSPAVG